ncbi:Formin-2 like [Actinidia chinensis var. chinensis]|uniref:Formin-2 like n=1 Tax=Actinidia chinensis var. chinensis TaxID=1590841 RepID=A0A2R6PPZ8_ACTCC|nr:Formin-2 like [Actinidia chinensis var. chinensis]
MSFLNLGKRLQPARKAWKIFTSKLHSKLQWSKAITKTPKNRIKKSTGKSDSWPSLTFQRRLQHKKRRIQTPHILHLNRLQKRSKPVYIDDLFIEPALMAKGKRLVTEKRSTGVEVGKLLSRPADAVPRTNKAGVEGQEETSEADEIWESLGLASPMMQGIDERAEEFINRIRAEMQLQEMMARQL